MSCADHIFCPSFWPKSDRQGPKTTLTVKVPPLVRDGRDNQSAVYQKRSLEQDLDISFKGPHEHWARSRQCVPLNVHPFQLPTFSGEPITAGLLSCLSSTSSWFRQGRGPSGLRVSVCRFGYNSLHIFLFQLECLAESKEARKEKEDNFSPAEACGLTPEPLLCNREYERYLSYEQT